MCSAQQAANEYVDLLKLWSDIIKPELFGYTKMAPNNWRSLHFTTIFDRFCHFIVVEVSQQGLTAHFPTIPHPGTAQQRQIQFENYVLNFLPHMPMDSFRIRQFNFAQKFLGRTAHFPATPPDPADPTEQEVRQFFLDIHAVSHGQYTQVRKDSVQGATLDELADILKCFDRRRTSIHTRIKTALTNPPNGVKITNLGPASMAEIPGWLLITHHSEYPIVNGKFVRTLDHLGLYNSLDTCFPGS